MTLLDEDDERELAKHKPPAKRIRIEIKRGEKKKKEPEKIYPLTPLTQLVDGATWVLDEVLRYRTKLWSVYPRPQPETSSKRHDDLAAKGANLQHLILVVQTSTDINDVDYADEKARKICHEILNQMSLARFQYAQKENS